VIPLTQSDEERLTYYLSKQRQLERDDSAKTASSQTDLAILAQSRGRVQGADQLQGQNVTDTPSNDGNFLDLLLDRSGLSSSDEADIFDDPLLNSRRDRQAARLELIRNGVLDGVDVDGPFVDRQAFFDQMTTSIEQSAELGAPAKIVTVRGEVKEPGIYPLPQSGSVSDVLLLAGGLSVEADAQAIELVQRTPDGFEVTKLSSIDIDQLNTINAGSEIVIRKDRNQIQLPSVTVTGFVRYPGTYRMPKGSTLSDLIQRAGGITDEVDLRAVIFSRKTLREKEQAQLERLRAETESQLAQVALQGAAMSSSAANNVRAGAELAGLLRQVENTTAVGRLVIDVPKLLAGHIEQDVLLENGDALVVPGIRQSVTVLGEVLYPTSHIFELGNTPRDYIKRSGGVNSRADEARAYIIRANGSVEPLKGQNFIAQAISGHVPVEPGDTIVIPRDVDDVPALQLWTAVTQIVYQSAIAISAIGGIDF
jgi:polysaccharide export outer membrane protein